MKKYCLIMLLVITVLYFFNIDKYLEYQFENSMGYVFVYCIIFLIRQNIKPQEFLQKERIWLLLFAVILLIDILTMLMG